MIFYCLLSTAIDAVWCCCLLMLCVLLLLAAAGADIVPVMEVAVAVIDCVIVPTSMLLCCVSVGRSHRLWLMVCKNT